MKLQAQQFALILTLFIQGFPNLASTKQKSLPVVSMIGFPPYINVNAHEPAEQFLHRTVRDVCLRSVKHALLSFYVLRTIKSSKSST